MLRVVLCLFLVLTQVQASTCKGRFLNPITDVCWSCLFPISIGSVKVSNSNRPDTPNPASPICYCQKGNIPQVGIAVGFWEPIALVDVTRVPFCFMSLGGLRMIKTTKNHGGHGTKHGRGKEGSLVSNYQVHYVKFPVFFLLSLFMDFLCLEKGDVDVGYISEFDPLWNDEELAFLINPEAALFGNKFAQLACVADCTAATARLPLQTLFWCDGCQGSLYPFTGANPAHVGGVQSSLLMTGRLLAKMHRQFMLPLTSGCSQNALCYKNPAPVIIKNQYRLQMVYPSRSRHCDPLGRSEVMWSSGKEVPYKGEDFVYLIWRKRNCCMRAM